jgi:tetratricopeptide (TPR) repeat protein
MTTTDEQPILTIQYTLWHLVQASVITDPVDEVSAYGLALCIALQVGSVSAGIQPWQSLLVVIPAARVFFDVFMKAHATSTEQQPTTVRITPHMVAYQIGSGEPEMLAWTQIRRVRRRAGLLFLDIDQHQAASLTIPNSAFSGLSERDRFYSAIFEYWKEAQAKRHDKGLCKSNRPFQLNLTALWFLATLASQVFILAIPDWGYVATMALWAGIAVYNIPRGRLNLLRTKATRELNARQFDEAVKTLTLILAKTPSDPRLYDCRGFCHWQLGNLELAKQDLEVALLMGAQSMPGYRALSNIALRQKQYNEALSFAKAGLAIVPKDPAILNTMAQIQWRTRNLNDAMNTVDELTHAEQSGNTWKPLALMLKSCIYAELGKLDEAIECANQAIEASPEFDTAIVNRAQLYIMIGKPDQALVDLANRGAEPQSDEVKAERHRLIGLANLFKGNITEAKKNIDAAIATKEDGYSFATKAIALAMEKNYQEALPLLDKAIERDAFCAEAYWIRSQIHRKRDDKAAADNDAAKASEMNYIPFLEPLFMES